MTTYRVGEILVDNEDGHIEEALVCAYLASDLHSYLVRRFGPSSGYDMMSKICNRWDVDKPGLPGWMRFRNQAMREDAQGIHDLQNLVLHYFNVYLSGKFVGILPDHPGVYAIMRVED